MKKLLVLFFILSGCASYQMGQGQRAFPGGYDRIAIPVFVNKTPEVGIEVFFADALRREFERSHLAKVTTRADAQVIVEGIVTQVTYNYGAQVSANTPELTSPTAPDSVHKNPLPRDTVLNKDYTASVNVTLVLRKVSDGTTLRTDIFTGARHYLAPLLGTPGIASSDVLYNQNSRVDVIATLAKDMMSEAHDRITENF